VDLDDVWKSIGFSTKTNAKRYILKHFSGTLDFIENKSLIPRDQRSHIRGGQNNINIDIHSCSLI